MRTVTRAEAGNALRIFAWALCIIGPLAFSGSHGGRFMQKMGGDESWKFLGITFHDSAIMMGIGICIIFSSPIVGMFIAISNRNNKLGSTIGGIVVWLCIVAFSMCTTTLATINKAESTVHAQIHESDAVKTIKDSMQTNRDLIASKRKLTENSIASNDQAVKDKQEEIRGRDAVKWQGMRDDLSNDISSLNYRNEYISNKANAEIAKLTAANLALSKQLTDEIEKGADSPLKKSINALEKFGITVAGIGFLVAFLLDLIPFYSSTQVGSSIRMVREQIEENHEAVEIDADVMERSTVKKHQRPNLKAVA